MTDRGRILRRAAPLLLVVTLAVAWLPPTPGWLRLAMRDADAAEAMGAAVAALPDGASVLVGFDPDLGTYAEVRPTVRVLLAALLERDARLAFVSLTAEGRALARVEIDRLERDGTDAAVLDDRGFVAGAEAGLVDLATTPLADVAAIVVVGGNDLGPRSWVEQVLPRIDDVPVLAVSPTVLLPEVQPYAASGQLDAALLTPGDGAAYRALASGAAADEPPVLPILVGMLAAAGVLGQALGARALAALRAARPREA